MKLSVIIASLFALAACAFAASDADQLYSSLERRLQSLKSLEIRYQVQGNADGNAVEGTMIWIRPDRFYHDTPEWTVCQTGDEQWRYLKTQNTLIREAAAEQSEFSPQNVLFDLKHSFQAVTVQSQGDSHRVLVLNSSKPDVPGKVMIEFPAESTTPDMLDFPDPNGGEVAYRIVKWQENIKPDMSLFTPPTVPPENMIDFRGAEKGK